MIKPLLRHVVPLVVAACVCAQATAAETDYPTKPIRMTVAFTAGGTTDVLARDIANQLSKKLKQTVVVENRAGAGGNIGSETVGNSPADGYSLLASSVGPIAINPTLFTKLRINPLEDLVAVVPIADVPSVLIVGKDAPYKSVKELVAYAKSHEGQLNFGSTGVGTAAHLSGVLLDEKAGIKTIHVPYKGAEAMNDLIAGRIQFMFATLPSAIGHIKSGQLRALAVAGKTRSAALPDVPTVTEAGVAEVVTGSWFGIFAPKGTPAAVVEKLNVAVNEIVAMPEIAQRFAAQGAEPMPMTAAQYQTFVREDSARWKPIVISSGAQID